MTAHRRAGCTIEVVERQSLISPEVLARYAGDAAREVPGVSGLAESPLHRGKAVEVADPEGAPAVTIDLELEWASAAHAAGSEVQRRVADYLERMVNLTVASLDVVVDVGAPPAKQ